MLGATGVTSKDENPRIMTNYHDAPETAGKEADIETLRNGGARPRHQREATHGGNGSDLLVAGLATIRIWNSGGPPRSF